jgi:hypothetical protein
MMAIFPAAPLVAAPFYGLPADQAVLLAAFLADQLTHDSSPGKSKACPTKAGGQQPMMGMADPNKGRGSAHGGNPHNQLIDDYINNLPDGAANIRKNQQQVDSYGNTVGNNRPDIQYDLNGQHYNVEFDNNPLNAIEHFNDILGNDPMSSIEINF